MKLGKIITADPLFNPELPGEWLELFPDGSVPDMTITTAIPRDMKRASGKPASKGQSPLLVELKWWNANNLNHPREMARHIEGLKK